MALGPTTVLEPTRGSHHVSATLPPCMGFALLLSAVCVPVSLRVDGLASKLGQRSTLTSWSAGVIWGRAALLVGSSQSSACLRLSDKLRFPLGGLGVSFCHALPPPTFA